MTGFMLLLLLFAFPAFALAQLEGLYAVRGKIHFDSVGDYGQTVEVQLAAFTGKRVGRSFTDVAGNFSFANIPAGDYTLNVNHPGFESVSQRVYVGATRGRLAVFLRKTMRLIERSEPGGKHNVDVAS